ncbi:hypothetical protein DY000_02033556 [Brassica cretica]|uniref:At2g35280-like TPR domain-containing protein n=1 Tax=Brassica cretica TaxID=69181 RepID=A0ABQ7DKP4_BRACR|nr:hypothetical protein DY000_02033556 [Brassica cretica]
MSNSNLASLPPSMLHKILSKINEANALRTFRLRCYQAGNLEAIYMRGMYEFFVLHLFDERREKICLAGERGLLWAKYVDGMLNLAFSVDARGFVHNYPSFSREFVDRMNYMITTSLSSGPWGYEKPEMDLEHGGHAIVVSGNVQLGTSAMIFTWPVGYSLDRCGVQRDASERMRARVFSRILNRGSGCENGGENNGDNGGEITGGENDGLERIDGNRLRNRL